MAHANRKKFGAGQQDQGKGDGTGGMSAPDIENLPDNEILSNRATSRHSDQRGLDSRHVSTEQYHEHVDNHAPGAGEPGAAAAGGKLADERPDGQEMAEAGEQAAQQQEETMNSELQQRIETRAHQIWETEGRPDGRHVDHWTQAEREIGEEMRAGDRTPADSGSAGSGLGPSGIAPTGSAGDEAGLVGSDTVGESDRPRS
ncbi:DUF2934 domain-containing protein [Celeribacter indicus]|uniref:DUF2934 domain-containing protein n=1 Tax=Celeribacter indicus TaxID=1208324 RepID=A0A0B5DW82_9RHOB|nr:DUF2934 domain-containing protein [Celeribacter indicus]AJE47299.1 hypothetical protein P73_2584 [Celeribacter indicus]SDW02796.1 Protein of unknown function [Celeribacter indicus]